MKSLKRQLLSSLLVVLAGGFVHADVMSGGTIAMTKDLFGASGSPTSESADFSLRSAFGESMAGAVSSDSSNQLMSGYLAGGFGSGVVFSVVSSQVGVAPQLTFFQDGIQVGAALNAPVTVVFSDQLAELTLSSGVSIAALRDHNGLSAGTTVAFSLTHDFANRTITLLPASRWTGNTLYDVRLLTTIQSIDGAPLEQSFHIYFLTMLDPGLNNVVMSPAAPPSVLSAAGISATPISIRIPPQALSDYAVILMARDPQHSPLRVDPSVIQEANRKARESGNDYRTPISIQELVAYNTRGEIVGPLSQVAEISTGYNLGTASQGSVVRPRTLSWWTLDETHQLWVKVPASQRISNSQSVTAPVTRFSVFALMGAPDGSAADSFAFPVPWRPHGPNAGPGNAQTGTETSGITFSNLPSECSIKIFTIAGDLIRELYHSDLGGLLAQELWDVKTNSGEPAASGVYLWQVSSSADTKTGKLMVIR